MLTTDQQAILNKKKHEYQVRLRYYTVLAVLLIIFVWVLYFELKRTGTMLIAIVLSLAIWYYPYRYNKKIKKIDKDLKNGETILLNTSIYAKSTSKINRLETYYYLHTDEEDFEVSKMIYDNFKENTKIRVLYTPVSQTILALEIVT